MTRWIAVVAAAASTANGDAVLAAASAADEAVAELDADTHGDDEAAGTVGVAGTAAELELELAAGLGLELELEPVAADTAGLAAVELELEPEPGPELEPGPEPEPVADELELVDAASHCCTAPCWPPCPALVVALVGLLEELSPLQQLPLVHEQLLPLHAELVAAVRLLQSESVTRSSTSAAELAGLQAGRRLRPPTRWKTPSHCATAPQPSERMCWYT